MIVAGIDVGAKTTKAIIMNDGHVIGRSIVLTGFDQVESAEKALQETLREAGIERGEIGRLISTGMGRGAIGFAQDSITEMMAMARAANYLFPQARTVIDVGAEEGRAIKCDAEGRVVDIAANEKCAAGAGTFVETMARALEVGLEEMGPLSLQSEKSVPMNAQCTVFAESEVVSLIHARTPKTDIVHAVHDAIASRIASMVRRIGINQEVVLGGGVARNPGFVKSLEDDLQVRLLIPEDPEYLGALGAALVAASN